ncbi:ABC transporter ATP-binding protein [Streptomyces sp. NPDC048109]|uniref:ABC transporter ATP-binding protein n=1 Tax=Streptomyces TaxID=1883 RepID=UPI0033DF3C1C
MTAGRSSIAPARSNGPVSAALACTSSIACLLPPHRHRLERITVAYPGHRKPVLDGLDLKVANGRLLALLGPSGCGKTTTVQVASGLLTPSRGAVHLGGTEVTRIPPERRGAAVVFQQPMLLPHRRWTTWPSPPVCVGRSRRDARTSALAHLERVGLGALAVRYPRQLSGGQAQRVALARALAAEPAVLLLDEPFSALDPSLRHTMRDLLTTVQRELAVTTVLVTHDQTEAAAVADTVALLDQGRLLHQAQPADLYARPASLAVARFLGCPTALPGHVTPQGRFACPLGELDLPHTVAHRGPGHLVIRPEAVQLGTGPDTVADRGARCALGRCQRGSRRPHGCRPRTCPPSARPPTRPVGARPAAPAGRGSLGGAPTGLSALPVML